MDGLTHAFRFNLIRVVLCGALPVTACATSGDLSLGTFADEAAAGAPALGQMPSGGIGSGSGGADNLGGAGSGGSSAMGGMAMGGAPVVPPCSSSSPLPTPARRFDFSGTGVEVVDLVGGPSGTIVGNAMLTGTGSLALDGDDYVDLPNGILGNGESVTIMLWATPEPGPAYFRLFDFGTSSEGEDPTGPTVGTFYLALATETGFEPSGLALLMGRGGPSSEDKALTAINVEDRSLVISVVIDGGNSRAQLYFAGEVVSETEISGPLSDIDDVNNWLGRSQYAADPYSRASYEELRIYDSALSGCEISALSALGADTPN